MNQLERYYFLKEKGICPRCKEKRDGKTVLCKSCNEKQRRERADTVKKFRSAGLCPVCGKVKLFPGEKSCLECNARFFTYRERRKRKFQSIGMCVYCGKKELVNNRLGCADCLEKFRIAQRQHKEMAAN